MSLDRPQEQTTLIANSSPKKTFAESLIVFARFPEPGNCKTRLIPALGAEGAAELHAAMTAHTLGWALRLAYERSGLWLEVRTQGGRSEEFEARFGSDASYVPQCHGDLGDKLLDAARSHKEKGFRKAVIVGTDCPQLNEQIVTACLQRLDEHSVCFAPAADGGYTLVGLRLDQLGDEMLVALFQGLHCLSSPEGMRGSMPSETANSDFKAFESPGIDWGTARVLEQSLTAIQEFDRLHPTGPTRISLLPTLLDVDEPEDLPVWEKLQQANADCGQLGNDGPRRNPELSIIIPCYGPEDRLAEVIQAAKQNADCEIIVSAAGDAQAALNISRELQVQFIHSQPPRSRQLNAAARLATAENLLFVHADTLLPKDYASRIKACLAGPEILCGAFRLHIDSGNILARCVELGANWRSRLWHMPYGDQALFVRRSAFDALGGFPDLPIMEDYEFMRRIKRRGRVGLASDAVKTSDRRWRRLGYFRTTLTNQILIVGYHLGISPKRLANLYRLRRPK